MTLILSNDDVRAAMDPADYIAAMEEAFAALGRREAINATRIETSIPNSHFTTAERRELRRLMRDVPLDADPLHSVEALAAGKRAKDVIYRLKAMSGGYSKIGLMALRIDSTLDTLPVIRGNPRGVKLPLGDGWRYTGIVLLFKITTGELVGIIPDGEIQTMRVGATTALGVKYLSRKDSSVIGLLGSGAQARAALLTVTKTRNIKRINVYSPNADNRKRFAASMSRHLELDVVAVDSPERAVSDADIMLTATTAVTPIFKTKWLQEGVHLGTVNPFEAEMTALKRCDRVVTNVRPFGGSKDLVHDYVVGGKKPLTVGRITNTKSKKLNWNAMEELGSVINGKKRRVKPAEITFHINNIGLGMQFAAAGAAILRRAREKNLGQEIPTGWFLQKEHT